MDSLSEILASSAVPGSPLSLCPALNSFRLGSHPYGSMDPVSPELPCSTLHGEVRSTGQLSSNLTQPITDCLQEQASVLGSTALCSWLL